MQNPERVLELLELLKDDPSTIVRRSVANNLNDLGKVRPDLLDPHGWAWLKDASPERRALVEHALRSAVKRGDADALRLLGYGQRRVSPSRPWPSVRGGCGLAGAWPWRLRCAARRHGSRIFWSMWPCTS